MSMKRPLVAIPLSGRVPGRASGPSQSWVDGGGGSQCVSGKVIGYLDFSRSEVFIGEGAASKVDQGALTTGGHGPGAGHAPGGVATLWLCSISSSVLWKLR
jgi:hypothetical protein